MHEHEDIQRVVRSFREINKAMHRILRDEADKMGATAIQILVLRVLAKKPNIGLGELAEHIQSSNSTTSGVVDRLVKAGLVSRKALETDRRSLTMCLTPEGAEKEKKAYTHLMNRLAEQLQDLSAEDLESLLTLHDRLLEKIQ